MTRSSLFFSTLTVLLLCTAAEFYVGHWEKTWKVETTSRSDANLGFAFSGWSDIDRVLSESGKVYSNLMGRKIITIGGGNALGRWSHATLQNVNAAIDSGRFSGYSGIAFDVEEGDSGLSDAFMETFKKAKGSGYLVVVTISHAEPYDVSDSSVLMSYFITSGDIDIISPMMYKSETQHLNCSDDVIFDTVDPKYMGDVKWWWFQFSNAAVVPSLWKPDHYGEAEKFLKREHVIPSGYIAWCG